MEALELETISLLVALLKDSEAIVRAKAALAIETIAITTPGKFAFLKANALDNLIPLIHDDSSEIRVNSLKAITCLSEAPEGRKKLLEHIDQVEKCVDDPIQNVAKHAKIAVKVITWKP